MKRLLVVILTICLLCLASCNKKLEDNKEQEEKPIVYTVRFLDQNGTLIKEEQVEKGKNATAPILPKIEATVDKTYTTSWDKEFNNILSNLDVKVIVHEEIRKYTMTFNLYDSEDPILLNVNYNENTPYFDDPVREGYLFAGWFYDEDCKEYFNFYRKVKQDTNVYSLWYKKYKVNLFLNEGNVETNVTSYYENMRTKVALPVPTKEGYYFRGYYNNPEFTGNPEFEIPVGSTGDKDFYASYTERKLENAYISYLGDSITTYANYIPSDYATFYPGNSDLESVKDTWWHQVTTNIGGRMLVNNSCGGSAIIGGSSTAASSITRLKRLASTALGNPDILVIYMGINDCYNGSTKAAIKEAYSKMLDMIYDLYPQVFIVICNYGYEEITLSHPGLHDQYNEMISEIALEYNLPVADIASKITNSSFLVDHAHPNKAGMKLIAEEVTKTIKENYNK